MKDKITRGTFLRSAVAALGMALVPSWAAAQDYPNKAVRIVVPYAAGGSVDIVARGRARPHSPSQGQQVIVDNKGGASGNIGTEMVARSAPDGYTLVIIPDSNMTVNPHLYPAMSFDPVKDLAPISLLTRIGVGLVVNPAVPARTVPELLAYAKTLPNGLSFGSPGSGTPHHLAGEMLKQVSGVKMVHIPYKGGGPTLIDVVGNQVPSAFIALAIAAPHIKSGKLRLLAVTQSTRSSLFPETPTIGESVKGFDVTSWMAMFAPAGTPPDIIQKLSNETRKALSEPAMSQALAAQSLDVVVSTPVELKERVQAESARWGALIKANGITAQ
jgi:tripartite-type tricarboxylate transporter receptor subunit TctC